MKEIALTGDIWERLPLWFIILAVFLVLANLYLFPWIYRFFTSFGKYKKIEEDLADLKIKYAELSKENADIHSENVDLKKQVQELLSEKSERDQKWSFLMGQLRQLEAINDFKIHLE